jgi:dTDP-4-dehydrorhamnose 3,5-epimerase
MAFTFKRLALPEVILIESSVFPDERGSFTETFKASEFEKNGVPGSFVQENFSHSKKGVVRGLHYQLDPKAQGKLIRVLSGKVLDVAVDMRRQSPTFLQSVSVELSDENGLMLFIPAGFAHGFSALTYDVRFVYKCTAEYSKEHERGVRFDDPDIHIDWKVTDPILSENDRMLPYAKDAVGALTP